MASDLLDGARAGRRPGAGQGNAGYLRRRRCDLDLGRPLEVMTDMSKSRKLGFTAYQDTRDSFFDLFNKLRSENLIP